VDINTGYIRDGTYGLSNLFSMMHKGSEIFTDEDFRFYGETINTLKDTISSLFGLDELFFTAPTFITRLDGRSDWEPAEVHDEYWHPHVDRENTPHYFYSGLLYLSTYKEDFEGGRYVLLGDVEGEKDGVVTKEEELVVEPRAGRVVIFSSGQEHEHYVERLTSGTRYVLAFWFTCDASRKFEIYLDGSAHTRFAHEMGDQLERREHRQKHDQTRQHNGMDDL